MRIRRVEIVIVIDFVRGGLSNLHLVRRPVVVCMNRSMLASGTDYYKQNVTRVMSNARGNGLKFWN